MNINKLGKKDKWYYNEFRDINKLISHKQSLNLDNFHRIRNFKIQTPSIEEEEKIIIITKKAFNLANKDKIQEAVVELQRLDGV